MLRGKAPLFALAALIVAAPLVVAVRAARAARTYLWPPRGEVGPPPAFARPVETVSFRTRDGLKLEGWWEPSANGAAVVWVHGWGQTRADWAEEGRWLAEAGFGVLLFDLRAHGRSEGDHSTYGADEQKDVEAALDYAKSRGAARLGLAGFSIGASAVAGVAARRDDVDALFLLSPFPNVREAIESDFGKRGPLTAWPAVWALQAGGVEMDQLRPIDDLPKLQRKPLFVLAGERETDPAMDQRMFAAARPKGETWLVPGAEHGQYRLAAPDEYKKRVMAFFAPLAGPPTSP